MKPKIYISPFLVPSCQAGDSQSISTSAQHPAPGRWMGREVLRASFAVPFVLLLGYISEVDKHRPSRIFFLAFASLELLTLLIDRQWFSRTHLLFKSAIHLYKTQIGLYSPIDSFLNLH